MWSVAIEPTATPAEVVAGALGCFALLVPPDPGWFAQGRLRDRVAIAARQNSDRHSLEELGDAAVTAAEVWERRDAMIARLDSLPLVLSHGDAIPRNLLRHDGPTMTAIDWAQVGYAPVGADLASYSMWVESNPVELISAYLNGLGPAADQHRPDRTGPHHGAHRRIKGH